MKTKITIIKVGYIDHILNLEKIENWKSKLFEIVDIQNIEYLPNSDIHDAYLDQKFTKESLSKIISSCPEGSDFAVAITSYRFLDNFYMHRLNENRVGVSLYGITEILEMENIPIENFVIKQLYEICALNLITNNNEVYNIVHRDTRGCLFDMNGDRTNILYNTEKPIICESCKEKFKKKQIAQGTISNLNKELKRIRKPIILKIERYIKKYPLVSMIISAIIAVSISSTFDLIWKIIKPLIQKLIDM
jgi:hypothetical protein